MDDGRGLPAPVAAGAQPEILYGALSHGRRLLILAMLLACSFMTMIDMQIVSTALPMVVGELGGMNRFSWVGSAYLVAHGAVMPISGKLGDLLGRRLVLIAALAIFMAGSLACGLAPSMEALVAARFLQGLGAGGVMVSVYAAIGDLFGARDRARYQSYTSLVLLVAASLGPALGGLVAQHFGWRWIFMLNPPLCLAILFGIWRKLPRQALPRRPAIDYAGAAALAVAVAMLVLWADSGQVFGHMLAPGALTLPAVATLALALWYRGARRAREPVIPLHLFGDRSFPLLLVVGMAFGSVAIGMVNFHALFLQMTTGLAPARAGLFFIAITCGLAAGTVMAGRVVARTGHYRPLMVAGLVGSAICFVLLTLLPVGTPLWALAATLMAQGVALGLGNQSPMFGVQQAAAAEDLGTATGAILLARIAGAALAMSVYGSLLATHLAPLAGIGIADPGSFGPNELQRLPAEAQLAARQIYAGAFGWVYRAAALILLCGALAALAIPRTARR